MYLKSIEVYGFKSFPQKMIFKFDQGITAIVGPNGSGKSNIADAVRWVLGEQSAKLLRGAKMQDVIFAGTETRKPLGYSQVDLTIDNQDMRMPIEYSEVTISRRVYRSGESEYSINGTECRLKDIHELFMDTGVGKEGYSIIGQGQIDKILSSKPEDRRELFDEATGIVKFKKRKMVAEKNLDEEKQNLIRINDIIRELEKQQELLREQAIIAKKYLDLKEELKNHEVNIFINESEKLNQSIKELEEKEEIISIQAEELKSQNEKIKEQFTKLNSSLDRLEKRTDQSKENMTGLIIDKEKKESSIQLIKEQISNYLYNLERIEKHNKELEIKKDQEESLNLDCRESLQELDNICKDQKALLMKKQRQVETYISSILEAEKSTEEIQTNRIERLNEISSVKTKMQRYSTMLENVEARKTTIDTRKELLVSSRNILEKNLTDHKKEMDFQLDEKQNLHKKKAFLIGTIEEKETQLSNLGREVREKNEKLQTTQSKLKALTEISEHYEGYSFSIKKVMELKNKNTSYKGIFGVVADLIQVEQSYETAIEIALGGNVQNIVTEDENVAKRLIEYLKTNKFGRATFLPLTSIKARENAKSISKKEPGFIGYASELVQFEKRFASIIEYLLGRVVVVEKLDHGIALAKKHQYSLRIVTLEGDLINPGGSLTGGAHKNQKNQFLSRKRELENYEKQVDRYQLELDALKDQYNQINLRVEQDKKTIEEITNKEYEYNLLYNQLSLKILQLEKDQGQQKEELSDIQLELEHLYKQEEEIKESSLELEQLLVGNEFENSQDEISVKKLSDEIQKEKTLKDQLSEEVTLIRVELSTFEQQLANNRENSNRIEQELKELNEQIQQNNTENERLNLLVLEKEKAIEDLEDEIKSLDGTILEAQKGIEELQNEKHKLSLKQEDLHKTRDEQNNQINLLEKDLLRLENSKDKYETQRDSQMDYMWDEYELTLNQALSYKNEALGSISALKKATTEMKDQIRKLGDVNVNSIEDFKVVSERYNFLMDQKEDLVRAEEMLRKVIEELQEKMIQQFNLKFKEISLKFNEVFRELFGGGKAMLEMSDREDILEAGIDLIAQPPGKKLQSMNLLSGGEKAFTAISLLFAIQSLKPSPFCVLDEIEAALDDSNVIRFANYLNKLAKKTQFIIITHRRGTMEVADTLYGITMQEKGVSTQVSVKLLEDVLVD